MLRYAKFFRANFKNIKTNIAGIKKINDFNSIKIPGEAVHFTNFVILRKTAQNRFYRHFKLSDIIE